MTYEICGRCGKLFNKNGRRYCEDCFEKSERDYTLIIEYIKEHSEATVLDIISNTGVTLKSINCLVEEGSVTYVNNKVETNNKAQLTKKIQHPSSKKGKFYRRSNRETL